MDLATATMSSPVGMLTLVASAAGLVAVRFPGSDDGDPIAREHPILQAAQAQLGEYFAGSRQVFTLPLVPAGTPFQQRVWAALLAIPFGETRSYADIAHTLGQPAATRAVGAANGRNPIAIVTPCHRVIGADGSLTGFGGGLATKRWLLAHERRDLFTR